MEKDLENKNICFLILPGFSPDFKPILKLKQAFEEKGYSTVATNFFGSLKINDFADLTSEKCIGEISRIIENTSGKYEKIIGVGLSLGGAFLLECAKNNQNLHGIISIGTPFKLKNRKLIDFGRFMLPIFYPFWKIMERNKKFRLLPIGAGPMVVDYLEGKFLNNLEKIKIPVLFIHSKNDSITDYGVLPKFSEKMLNSMIKTIFSENGNHMLDYNPEILVDYTENFLRDLNLIDNK